MNRYMQKLIKEQFNIGDIKIYDYIFKNCPIKDMYKPKKFR